VSRPLEALPLDELHRRRSARWQMYPPDVLPAFVAEMDFPLAEPIAAALHDAVSRGDTGYAVPGALPEAFAGFSARRWGWQVDPEGVLVVGDVLAGVTAALRWLTGPDDPVVVMPPVYPPFFTTVRTLAQRPLVEVPLLVDPAGRAGPDLDGLAAAFRTGARTLLLCHPLNPSGTVLRREELLALEALCAEHDVLVLSDEVHAPLAMPGTSFVPWPTLEGTARSIVLTSASKAWNVPGLKCAVAVAGSPQLARELAARVPMEARFGAGLLGVVAGTAAFTVGEPWLDAAVAAIDENRRVLLDLLDAHLPGARCRPPDAGYLAWVDLRGAGPDGAGLGDDPSRAMLARGRVAVSAGPTFGAGGAGHVRLTLATSPELLAETVRRMALALP